MNSYVHQNSAPPLRARARPPRRASFPAMEIWPAGKLVLDHADLAKTRGGASGKVSGPVTVVFTNDHAAGPFTLCWVDDEDNLHHYYR